MDKFNFEQVRQKIQQSRREMLVLLSNQAQNYFVSSWKKQGFDGREWKEVQRRKPETKAYKYPKAKGLQRRISPILVGAGFNVRGGTLRRAVSSMARTANINNGGFRMIVDLPYAGYLNEGTGRMPKRQFIGQTAELTQMQQKKITQVIDKIWQV